jgi:hypothetical protein
MFFQGTAIVFSPDDGAKAPKHLGDMHKMYAYARSCAFSWYEKGVCP